MRVACSYPVHVAAPGWMSVARSGPVHVAALLTCQLPRGVLSSSALLFAKLTLVDCYQ